MRLQAVNNVIIIKKDESPILKSPNKPDMNDMKQIPEPYTGYIDSIGFETNDDYLDYKVGDYIAFCDMGGAYIQMDDIEYVVITPDMVIGKLN